MDRTGRSFGRRPRVEGPTGYEGYPGGYGDYDERHEDREPPRESRLRRLAAAATARARREAATPDFGRLLLYQASGAAGDAFLAVALAGSLFFSVPEATARARVLLYLLLTMAPFAIVAPLLSRVLDRFRGSMRAAMVIAALGRGTLAWALATRLDTFYLFPIAFGVLILSRAALIVRGAILPTIVPGGRTFVEANASLSKAGALAAMVAGVLALGLSQWPGPATELLVGASIYYTGALPALRLSSARGRRTIGERFEARSAVRTLSIRQGVVASSAMRFLVGFLTFHLAFALRREDLGTIGLGGLVASAATGALIGALVAPRLRRRLREEGILLAALGVAGLSGIVLGNWFSLATASGLVLVFGIASGAAKVAFDAIVQRETPEAARGWAFARFESVLQLAWVAGALLPLILPIPGGPGVIAAGVAANVMGIVYLAGRRQAGESDSF